VWHSSVVGARLAVAVFVMQTQNCMGPSYVRQSRRLNVRSSFVILLALLTWGCAGPQLESFPDVTAAVGVLASPDGRIHWEALEFLAARPSESIPRLMTMVRDEEDGWVWALAALEHSRDDRAVPFLIALMKDNFYKRDADGKRIVYGYGSPHGCEEWPFRYGATLAWSLGNMGDKRAIPVLREATQAGDDEVKRKAYVARYKLKDATLDDLFEINRQEPRLEMLNEIEGIGWTAIHTDNRFAIEVFDRMAAEAQGDEWCVAGAHFWKIRCYSLLGRYDKAIRECDEVLRFPKCTSLVVQAERRKAELVKLIERNRAGVGAGPVD